MHGSPLLATDIDTLIRRDRQNLGRIGDALWELGAQRSTGVDAFITRIEEFETEGGKIDVLASAEGVGSYEFIVPSRSELILLDDQEVRVLDLPALIEAKETTFEEHEAEGRPRSP